MSRGRTFPAESMDRVPLGTAKSTKDRDRLNMMMIMCNLLRPRGQIMCYRSAQILYCSVSYYTLNKFSSYNGGHAPMLPYLRYCQ